MAKHTDQPIVGVGVILVNKKGEILVGKRKSKLAPKYSIFGGSVEMGETFEETAIREAKEETGLTIRNPNVIGITNNLETYKEQGLHTISVILLATDYTGVPKNMEKEKSEDWFWCDPNKLPEPHFDASRMAVECYLKNTFYLKTKN